MLALIESGEAGLVIGTHAVIQSKVKFKNLVSSTRRGVMKIARRFIGKPSKIGLPKK